MTKTWAQLQDEFFLPTGGNHNQDTFSETTSAGSKWSGDQPKDAPTLVDGKFIVKMEAPGNDPVESKQLDAPFFRYNGAYTIEPEAVMSVTFKGKVKLTEVGQWEVGLVQNVYIDSFGMRYSSGGQITVNNGCVLRLDVTPQAKQKGTIWMKDAVTKVNNPQPNGVVELDMDFKDRPSLETSLKGTRTRGGGKISENFRSARHHFLCLAGLVARKDGRVYQLAVTAEGYGFNWTLDVPNEPGSVDMSQALDWQAFVPRRVMVPPFPGNRQLRLVQPDANTWVNAELQKKIVLYEGDTTTTAPWGE
jgi:hypothetical protein